jgi:hypothetical protein
MKYKLANDARPQAMTLLLAAAISIALWFIPFAEILSYPFRIFVTFIHEGGHAIAALLTGNSVQSLSVAMNGSGETYTTQGGWFSQMFVSSAGYIGAMVVDRLYALFKDPTWQVRWVAAELVLKMSDTGQLPEFFDRIGSSSDGMSITEPLRYGQAIATMKGPQSAVEIVQSHLDSGPAGARLTALGYYYHAGTPADLARLDAVRNDKTKVPECSEQAKDCEWKCDIVVSGARETKDIKTVGEFYEFCVKPVLEQRQQQSAGKPAPN